LTIISALSNIVKTKEKSVVIDVGGGNGILAHLVSIILDIDVIVIDRRLPEINVDNIANKTKYTRIMNDISNINFDDFPYDNIYIICKHLCGTNLDIVMKELVKVKKIRGFVFAPCCYQKGAYSNFIGKDVLSFDEFRLLGCITEWKNHNTIKSYLPKEAYEIGKFAETIINSIRIYQFDRDKKFTVTMTEYIDAIVTPKNIMLIGHIA
jgi:ubiquinone/menaquinone biosynthesis C-methylase UbiE